MSEQSRLHKAFVLFLFMQSCNSDGTTDTASQRREKVARAGRHLWVAVVEETSWL